MRAAVAVSSFVLVDETGSQAQLRLNAPITTEAAAVLAAAASVVGPLYGITNCRVREIIASYRDDEQGPFNPTGSINPVGVFVFESAVAGAYGLVTVPGLLPELVLPGGELPGSIDLVAAPVAAFVSALSGGIWCNPFGNDLAACTAAYTQHRTYGTIYIP